MTTSILLSEAEIEELSGGYKRQADQLSELRRRGFYRAVIGKAGRVIVERAHYDAVCRGKPAANDEPEPKLKMHLLRQRA